MTLQLFGDDKLTQNAHSSVHTSLKKIVSWYLQLPTEFHYSTFMTIYEAEPLTKFLTDPACATLFFIFVHENSILFASNEPPPYSVLQYVSKRNFQTLLILTKTEASTVTKDNISSLVQILMFSGSYTEVMTSFFQQLTQMSTEIITSHQKEPPLDSQASTLNLSDTSAPILGRLNNAFSVLTEDLKEIETVHSVFTSFYPYFILVYPSLFLLGRCSLCLSAGCFSSIYI